MAETNRLSESNVACTGDARVGETSVTSSSASNHNSEVVNETWQRAMDATTKDNRPNDDDDDNDEDDERDRFSPVRFAINLTLDNNELADSNSSESCPRNNRRLVGDSSSRIPSKEEKQRQNEEIVIMESSSISSETGSWESVFPQRDVADDGRQLIGAGDRKMLVQNSSQDEKSKEAIEEKPVVNSDEEAVAATTVTSSAKAHVRSPIVANPPSLASISACFIDASTLLDDGEDVFMPTTATKVKVKTPSDEKKTTFVSANEDKSNELNLSDEEKLREANTADSKTSFDVKDQFSIDAASAKLLTIADAPTPPPSARERDRSEMERKQGTFLFQNSIHQYSGHAMSPKAIHDDNNSDFSLPSVYSGSSDPYNDCTSAFDTSSHHSSNCGDRDSRDYSELYQFSIGGSKGDSIVYPETPYNSILQVNAIVQRANMAPNDSAIASLSSSESNAGVPIPKPRRRIGDEDSVPIVSGGASVKDFTPKQCESPTMRRRQSEESPIISLGSMNSSDYAPKPRPRTIDKSSTANSWVVDMSDCHKKSFRRSSESSSTSTEHSGLPNSAQVERSDSSASTKGLGFYVSLNDMKPPRLGMDEPLSKSFSAAVPEPRKKPTGFFVDLSDNSSNATNTPPTTADVDTKIDDKKNMFSMFIDFGDDKRASRHDSPARFSSSMPRDMPIDSPIALRRNRAIVAENETKRHSWNAAKTEPNEPVREHKRSTSTSSEKGIMNIIDKIQLISKTSSMSIDTPNSPLDDVTCSKSISSYSMNSMASMSAHSNKSVEHAEIESSKRRQKDVRIGETFDKSSQGSITDGILSKNSSPTSNTDTDDVTFQNDEVTTQTMETIPESNESVVLRRHRNQQLQQQQQQQHTMESLQATIEKQKQLLNTVAEEPASFVKLSDMDKPAPKFELHDVRPKSVGSRIGKLFDPNKIGNRNTWHSMSKSTGNNLGNLASSVENLRSLTRIFPHLGKDLSNSLPINFEQSNPMSPNDFGGIGNELNYSDFSTSSATSSISRSGLDSVDEFSLSSRQPQRLGEDLLKMFLQEIATDVVIEVNGRRMRAHKCILRSRCQYFAAILAGGWVESAGNVISLSGYSYSAVHFALCHIYSGATHPPDGISLMELATLADLLGLEGLKEVAAYALKTTYCHSFHKPCSGCIDGVMQVFPVALNQGLDDLYRKCLRWSCKHYMKVWPSRAFSQLPSELVARCRQHIIAHMTSETVIQSLLDCDKLLALLAPCRWAVNIENSVRDIIDAAHDYVIDHFASLIASDGFLSLGQGQSWNISRLENMLLRSASSLTPDQACRSYQRITRLNSVLHAKVNKMHSSRIDKNIFNSDYGNDHDEDDAEEDDLDWSEEFVRLVSDILSAVEQCLIRQCSRAMKSNQWSRMDEVLRKKIQKLACLSEPVERRSRSGPRPVTYTPSSSHSNRAQDLYQVKMAIQAHSRQSHEIRSTNRTSHRQEKVVPKAEIKSTTAPTAVTNKLSKTASRAQVPDLISTIKSSTSLPKPIPPMKSASSATVANHRRSASETTNRPLSKNKSSASVDVVLKKPSLRDIRPRYLEPKRTIVSFVPKETTLKVRNRSSSGSSRTSSPCISTRRQDGILQGGKKALSDSITISRDSLSSPAKKSTRRKNASQENNDRLSVDSLGGSLHSSIFTNQTNSQESLGHVKDPRKSTAEPLKAIDNRPPLAQRPNGAALKHGTVTLSHTSSVNSSTPSSIATLKSKLSANSSVSSPRDGLKSRLTTPANPIPLSKSSSKSSVKSFLSAKSRQILAQKKALAHSDSSKSVPAIIKDNTDAINSVNKSSSTSNILKKTPAGVTLSTQHQRRSTKPPTQHMITQQTNSLMNPTKSSSMKMVAQNNKVNREHSSGDAKRKSTLSKKDIEIDIDHNGKSTNGSENDTKTTRYESKLERSSTFCKERSELPSAELQIID